MDLALQLIDPESYRQLQPLICKKFNLLDILAFSFRSGKLIFYSEAGIANAFEYYKNRPFTTMLEVPKGLDVDKLELREIDSIHVSRFDEIKQYLDRTKPRDNLEAIRLVLERLRDQIEKNFSIRDILIQVGDRRIVAK